MLQRNAGLPRLADWIFQFFFNQDFGHGNLSLPEDATHVHRSAFNSFLIKILVMQREARANAERAVLHSFQFFFNQDFGHAMQHLAECWKCRLFQFFFNQDFGHAQLREVAIDFVVESFNSFLIKILVMNSSSKTAGGKELKLSILF